MIAREAGALETIINGVVETSNTYQPGDYIMCGTEGERYVMQNIDFSLRYERSRPEPATSADLAKEGFSLYQPKGKIWGHEVTENDAATYFPAGQFIAPWGSTMIVEEGDFLAMPFPTGGELYRIERKAFEKTYTLGELNLIPSQAEALSYWEGALRKSGRIYRKMATVHAMMALFPGVLETIVDGVVEDCKKYAEGDYIMLGTRGGRYPMSASDFMSRYEHTQPKLASDPALVEEGFMRFESIGKIWAHEVSQSDLATHFPAGQFLGKWGGVTSVEPHDFIAMPFPTGGEVYRIKRELFGSTYTKVERTVTKRWSNVAIGAAKRLSVLVNPADIGALTRRMSMPMQRPAIITASPSSSSATLPLSRANSPTKSPFPDAASEPAKSPRSVLPPLAPSPRLPSAGAALPSPSRLPDLPQRATRVLCLHGTAANTNIFRKQLAPLLSLEMAPSADGLTAIEYIFIDGPRLTDDEENPQAKMNRFFFPGEVLREWDVATLDDQDRRTYKDRFEVAAATVVASIREHAPIDGIIGFSQGASLATLFAAAAAMPVCSTADGGTGTGGGSMALAADLCMVASSLRFIVNVCPWRPGWVYQQPFPALLFEKPKASGGLPDDEPLSPLASTIAQRSAAMRVLLVSGERDAVVGEGPEEVAKVLERMHPSVNRRVVSVRQLSHREGHRPFPADADDAELLAKSVRSFILESTRRGGAAPLLAPSKPLFEPS